MSKSDIDRYLFEHGWTFDGRQTYPFQWKHPQATGFVTREEAFQFTVRHEIESLSLDA